MNGKQPRFVFEKEIVEWNGCWGCLRRFAEDTIICIWRWLLLRYVYIGICLMTRSKMTNTSKNDKSWTCKEFLQVQTVIVMKDVEMWAEYLAESRNQSYIFLRVLQGFIKLFYPVRATCKPLEPSWVKKIATGTDLVLKVLETRWNRKNIEIFNTKMYGKILNDMHCQTELCEFE